MMRKLVFPLAAILLLAGCFSTPSKRYFQIVAMDKDAELHPKIGKALYIEPVRVEPLYDDFRVIYRVSPYEIKYYSSVFWANKPDGLIREAMRDYFVRKGGFPLVTVDVLLGDPAISLRSNLRLIEEIDNPTVWFGRLAMDLEFVDFKTGAVLARHLFDRRLPLAARQSKLLPSVVSQILVEELDVVIRMLAEAMQAKESAAGRPD